ncbi:preprotein translocase subunit SecG [Nonlabens dokdonensis]|jgi:preprotein translocase subunit SecG|uniref:Protein-export membrane protein SecG n=2 Tax=Nonlabens dokdonensis TaxID=328515 RepID=L7W785_NONDD|nr:preprotein translocase subunit SecG [Nonlabens dokdonensis]AGC75999.1 SecG domain containing protein [Nonlabens dokdonensis DSW-6]PZX43675.1 preprotein translocase subunit SecG [Nonlabens dokdonensis]
MTTFYIFLGLIVLVSFLLVVVIMVQNPKGGGLSSSFGGGGTQQLGGVKKTGDFLDKSTWVLSTALLVLILLASTTLIQDKATNTIDVTDPNAVEVPAEVPAPATTTTEETTSDSE